jgi:hypothetical protein
VNYIQLRLSIAGASPDTFLPDGLQYIFQTCQGVPRRIKQFVFAGNAESKIKKLETINVALLKELTDLD